MDAEEDAVQVGAAQGVMKRGFFAEDSAPQLWAIFGPRSVNEGTDIDTADNKGIANVIL
jgi:hypothetical protein